MGKNIIQKLFFRRMTGAFLGILLVSVLWLLFGRHYLKQLGLAHEKHEIGSQIQIQMLEVRRAEKDFLIRDLCDPAFYQKGTSEYLERHQAAMAQLQILLKTAPEEQQTVNDLALLASRYKNEFAALVAAYRKVGFQDWGILGQMREAIHKVEYALSEHPTATNYLLQLRRAEKDFLLRHDRKYSTRAFGKLVLLTEEIASLDPPSDSSLWASLENYRTGMTSLIQMHTKIGMTEDEGLRGAMRDTIHGIQPDIAEVIAQAKQEGDEIHRLLREQALLFSAIMLSMGAVVAVGSIVFMALRITRPISCLLDATQRVASGDYSTQVKTTANDEVGELTHAFNGMAKALDQKTKERDQFQQELIETSRRAGMAEVATGILHNVGNVLNSVNVTAALVTEKLKKSHLKGLVKTTELLNEHSDDLGAFFHSDQKGKLLPSYLEKLTAQLISERESLIEEVGGLSENIGHIKSIVQMQQSYGKLTGVQQSLNIVDIVEESLAINEAGLYRHGVNVVHDYEEVPEIISEKHLILQILINLISNAKYALDDSRTENKKVTLRIHPLGENALRIQVCDNGVGIAADNLTKIFAHGFTTKESGHGYGLHSSALAAKQLNSALSVHSDGPGQGAIFTLDLPISIEAETLACTT